MKYTYIFIYLIKYGNKKTIDSNQNQVITLLIKLLKSQKKINLFTLNLLLFSLNKSSQNKNSTKNVNTRNAILLK